MSARRRLILAAYLAALLLVLVGVDWWRPWWLHGTPQWQGQGAPPASRHVVIVPAVSRHPEEGQQLLVFDRAAGAWRYRQRTTTVPPDASQLSFRMDGDLLRISFVQSDHRLGDLVVLFPR